MVLVVPRSALLRGDDFIGVRTGEVGPFRERIRAHGSFQRRGDVEDDTSLKQIIPYVVVRRGGDIFLFQRTDQGGDARLHHLYSIGVGGHINRSDVGDRDPVDTGLEREIEEELDFSGPRCTELVGVLNDERNAVSQVHFGLVYVARTDAEVRVREADSLTGGFVGMGAANRRYEQMETWSQLVLEGLGWRS
jgi:predicted NUDIX family phosphoesterase